MRSLCLGLLAFAIGCGEPARSTATGSASAGEVPAPSAAPPASAPPGAGDGVAIEPPPDEAPDPLAAVAARPSVATGPADAAVAPHLEHLRAHHGGAIPFPLEHREAWLPGGRRAVLFTGAGAATAGAAEVRPLLLVHDASRRVLWQKTRPLAGTHERWRGLTVTPGPEGSVLVFWWDAASRVVAGRRWQFDGSVFADFTFLDVEDCSGLDALWWPGRGWVVTALDGTRARAELLRENGFRGFGEGVVDVGRTHDVLSPAVAAGGVDGVFHAYVGRERGAPEAAPARLWVTLHREDGSTSWKGPVDLGPVARGADGTWPTARIGLVTPARARVSVGERARDVQSDGSIPDGPAP